MTTPISNTDHLEGNGGAGGVPVVMNQILSGPPEERFRELFPDALPTERKVTVADAVDVLAGAGLYPCVSFRKRAYPYVSSGYFEYRCDSSSGPACAGGRSESCADAWLCAVDAGLNLARLRKSGSATGSEFYL